MLLPRAGAAAPTVGAHADAAAEAVGLMSAGGESVAASAQAGVRRAAIGSADDNEQPWVAPQSVAPGVPPSVVVVVKNGDRSCSPLGSLARLRCGVPIDSDLGKGFREIPHQDICAGKYRRSNATARSTAFVAAVPIPGHLRGCWTLQFMCLRCYLPHRTRILGSIWVLFMSVRALCPRSHSEVLVDPPRPLTNQRSPL